MASNSTISVTFKMAGDVKSFQQLTNNSEDFKKALQGALVEADKLPKKMGAFKDMQKSIAGLAAGFLSVKLAVNGVKDAVKTMANFERANSELAAVLGKTKEGVSDLTQAAQDLGRVTEFTASEVTALQTSLARLGFTSKQIKDMQESVLKFATAVGADLASAADFTGASLRSFGLQASDAGALLDMMAKSTSASALSFDKLSVMMSVVGPVAKAFGLTARDTVAMLGVMSNAGFDASSAATALRNILLKMADTNGDLAKSLGVTSRTMPEIIDGLKALNDRGVDLTETLELTDKRSVAAFNSLLSGAVDVETLYNQLGNANGALDEMYSTMSDNLVGAVKSLQSAWEGLILSFQSSTGPIKTAVGWLTSLVNKMTDYLSYQNKIDQGWTALDFLADQYGEYPAETAGSSGATATPTTTAVASSSESGESKTKKKAKDIKTLSAAMAEYRDSLQKTTLTSRALGLEQEGIDAQLAAMKSGLTRIIQTYGVEDENVKELIAQYRALASSRAKMGGYDLKKIDQFGTFGKESSGLKGLPVQEAKEYAENLSGVQTTLTAMSSIFRDMSGVMEDNAKGWISWISTVLTSVAQAVPAIQALVQARKAEANANLEASASGAASSVASIPFVGPVLAVAAVASVLASLASLPKFAKGGIAYGPTLGLFGEYSGASNNPEVVAPLDRLRSLIGDTQGEGKVEFVIEGRTLKGILKKMNELDRRS